MLLLTDLNNLCNHEKPSIGGCKLNAATVCHRFTKTISPEANNVVQIKQDQGAFLIQALNINLLETVTKKMTQAQKYDYCKIFTIFFI